MLQQEEENVYEEANYDTAINVEANKFDDNNNYMVVSIK